MSYMSALISEPLTYALCDPEVGWPVSSNCGGMLKAEGMVHAGIWHIVLFF